MSLSDLFFSASALPRTRAEIAALNYQFMTGNRAPDDLHESWADRLEIVFVTSNKGSIK